MHHHHHWKPQFFIKLIRAYIAQLIIMLLLVVLLLFLFVWPIINNLGQQLLFSPTMLCCRFNFFVKFNAQLAVLPSGCWPTTILVVVQLFGPPPSFVVVVVHYTQCASPKINFCFYNKYMMSGCWGGGCGRQQPQTARQFFFFSQSCCCFRVVCAFLNSKNFKLNHCFLFKFVSEMKHFLLLLLNRMNLRTEIISTIVVECTPEHYNYTIDLIYFKKTTCNLDLN